MDTVVNAVFRNGVFVPTIDCEIPENTEVQVIVRGPDHSASRDRPAGASANPSRSRRGDEAEPYSCRCSPVHSRTTP